MPSLPAREVWIEILGSPALSLKEKSHFPQGKCGLKYNMLSGISCCTLSLPAREVWIEISLVNPAVISVIRSLPAREVWIEIKSDSVIKETYTKSLPAREVWIEISFVRSQLFKGSPSLPAREVWIEIIYVSFYDAEDKCHFPQGKCGLK